MIELTVSDKTASAIIAFIKTHERDEIPDDAWDFCMKVIDGYFCMKLIDEFETY